VECRVDATCHASSQVLKLHTLHSTLQVRSRCGASRPTAFGVLAALAALACTQPTLHLECGVWSVELTPRAHASSQVLKLHTPHSTPQVCCAARAATWTGVPARTRATCTGGRLEDSTLYTLQHKCGVGAARPSPLSPASGAFRRSSGDRARRRCLLPRLPRARSPQRAAARAVGARADGNRQRAAGSDHQVRVSRYSPPPTAHPFRPRRIPSI